LFNYAFKDIQNVDLNFQLGLLFKIVDNGYFSLFFYK